MGDIWFISDTHFYHKNILKFTDDNGGLIRPGFTDVDHMNETLVSNWNAKVKPNDKVYHLGDVTFHYGPKAEALIGRLNGRKRLLIGNHDDPKHPLILKTFEKILIWRVFKDFGFTATHVPIHPGQLYRAGNTNVHGHTHDRLVMESPHHPDPRYINVCAEHTQWAPIHVEDLIKKIRT